MRAVEAPTPLFCASSFSFCRLKNPIPVTNGSRTLRLSHRAAHHRHNLQHQSTLELVECQVKRWALAAFRNGTFTRRRPDTRNLPSRHLFTGLLSGRPEYVEYDLEAVDRGVATMTIMLRLPDVLIEQLILFTSKFHRAPNWQHAVSA